jgi:hypothetical protein
MNEIRRKPMGAKEFDAFEDSRKIIGRISYLCHPKTV